MIRPDDTLNDDEMIFLHTLMAHRTIELKLNGVRKMWMRLIDMGFAKLTDHAPGDLERRKDAFVKISAAGRAYLKLNQ